MTALGPPDPYRHPLAWARYQAGGLKAYLAGPAWLRRQMRRQLLLALIERHVTRIVAVDGDGIRYLIDTADRGPITLRIFSEGRYEEPLVARVSGLLADVRDEPRPLENRAFVDVGANIGTATLVALKRFGATRALALEPHPANLRLLRMNLIANELEERATVMGVAASDGPGELELEMATHNIGDHRIRTGAESGRGAVEEGSRAVIRVPAVRLDEAVAEAGIGLDEIGLVWIDVQGHEPQVLKGADSLVDAAVPMLIEYWPYGWRAPAASTPCIGSSASASARSGTSARKPAPRRWPRSIPPTSPCSPPAIHPRTTRPTSSCCGRRARPRLRARPRNGE